MRPAVLPDDLTEEEGLVVLWELRTRFRWAGCTPTMLCDVEELLGRHLTGDEKDLVANSFVWSKFIRDHEAEASNEILYDLVNQLGLTGPEHQPEPSDPE